MRGVDVRYRVRPCKNYLDVEDELLDKYEEKLEEACYLEDDPHK